MKSFSFQLNAQQHYRFIVFIRILLASFVGFGVANLTVAMVGLLFPNQLAIATYTGFLISFIVWLLLILTVFSMKSTVKAVWLSIALLLSLTCIVSALKIGGSV